MKKFFKRDIKDCYEYVENSSTKEVALRVKKGPYKGIVYQYDKFQFGDKPAPNGTLPLHFTFNLLKNPKNKSVKDNRFIRLLGDVAIDIMESKLKNEGKLFDEEDVGQEPQEEID